MATYAKITDFAAKDALLTGNPSKIVKGTEIGAEFDSIATADASNIKGPTSAVTDNAVVRWDTTTGRVAQGSGVTIDDSNVVTASGFSGPHNGTVGATTPSTGAFTTLSASGTVSHTSTAASDNLAFSSTSSTTGANYQTFISTAGTVYSGIDNSAGSALGFGAYKTGISAPQNYVIQTAGATRGEFSSTGLAVTGALSATGVATLGLGGTSAQQDIAFINGSSASGYGPQARFYRNNVYKGAIGSQSGIVGDNSDNLYLNAITGASCAIGINGSTVVSVSTTGFAVTGALSSTGAVEPASLINIRGAQNGNIAKAAFTRTDRSWSITNETNLRFYTQATDTVSPSTLVGEFSSTGLAVTGALSASGGTIFTPVAFASLPASPVAGQRAMINNSVAAPAFLSTAAGGGSTTVPVFYNGTTWLVG